MIQVIFYAMLTAIGAFAGIVALITNDTAMGLGFVGGILFTAGGVSIGLHLQNMYGIERVANNED